MILIIIIFQRNLHQKTHGSRQKFLAARNVSHQDSVRFSNKQISRRAIVSIQNHNAVDAIVEQRVAREKRTRLGILFDGDDPIGAVRAQRRRGKRNREVADAGEHVDDGLARGDDARAEVHALGGVAAAEHDAGRVEAVLGCLLLVNGEGRRVGELLESGFGKLVDGCC